jgi:DNA repair protein RadB
MELIEKIMTGSHDLNNFLDGGYEKGIITLLYGPPGSGKSNIVMLAGAYHASQEKKIIFIDSEGSFSVERIAQMARHSYQQILSHMVILKATNFAEQKKIFHNLSNEIKSKNIGMIIVDSITMLYRLALADARKKGFKELQEVNAELAREMRILHELARKNTISVLITGQVYSEFLSEEEWLAGKEAGVNVVGGDILKYWSKCILELQKKNGARTMIIKKHRSMPEKSFNFEIINEGIRKKGWLL